VALDSSIKSHSYQDFLLEVKLMDIPQNLLKELKLYLMMQTENNDAEAQYLLYRLDQLEEPQEERIEAAKLVVPPIGEELKC
jgi:hypothetical protein